MDKVARIHSLVVEAGQKIQASRENWEEHLKNIENQWTTFNEQFPTTLVANTWASQNPVLAALGRIHAHDELLKMRMSRLMSVAPGLFQFDIIAILGSTLQQWPIGLETRSWQLISAISGVEALNTERSLIADGLEAFTAKRLEKLAKFHEGITTTVNLPEFAGICKGVRALGAMEKSIDTKMEGDDDGHELKEQIEEVVDRVMTLKSFISAIEHDINVMHRQMTNIGIKVARQTLIQEYFKPLNV